jgi:hypothetical protein
MKAFVDGNMVALVNDDFIDLQESDAVWVEGIASKFKTPQQMHEELQSWDKLIGHKDYDQGYILGFRMALKWALGMEPPKEGGESR